MEEQKVESRADKLDEILDIKRKFYTKEIKTLILGSGDFDKIPEIQINMLSLRHQLIDYLSIDLTKAMIQAKTARDNGRKKTLVEIKTKYNIKIGTEKEKTIVIDADTRELSEMIELLDGQMYAIKEKIKLLDNLGFAIKNEIEMYKFKHGE